MSSHDPVFEKLAETIKEFLQVARAKGAKEELTISMNTDLYKDLGMDSLEAMDLVVEIEQAFNISVEARELISKNKVADIVAYIKGIQARKS